MGMRISSKALHLQWLSSFQRQQSTLASVQEQITSGKRIKTAADDPAGAAQAVLLRQGLDRMDNFSANGETARRRLSLEESALTQSGDILNRLRELAIQAAVGTQTQESRTAIAAEAEELLLGLVTTSNAQDGEGRYLFAGNLVQVRPFNLVAGAISYAGDTGARFQRIADSRTVQENDPGSSVFLSIPTGNGTFTVEGDATNQGTAYWTAATPSTPSSWVPDTYTVTFTAPDQWTVVNSLGNPVGTGSYAPGEAIVFGGAAITLDGTPATGDTFTVGSSGFQDMFGTVRDFIQTLNSATSTPEARATFQNDLNANLQNIDQALTHLTNVRSQVGARLSSIDQQLESNADVGLELSKSLSQIQDVDYASAISKLEQQMIGLQAAQKAFATTRSLSLFDLL